MQIWDMILAGGAAGLILVLSSGGRLIRRGGDRREGGGQQNKSSDKMISFPQVPHVPLPLRGVSGVGRGERGVQQYTSCKEVELPGF